LGEPAVKNPVPYDEYLRRLEASDERLEYWDGEIFALAAGTPGHSYTRARVTMLLGVALQDGPCRTFNSHLRVRVQCQTIMPDATVICGRHEPAKDDPHAVTNPTVIVEVPSPSTELWDRSAKVFLGLNIPGLQHYLLVSLNSRSLEHFRRDGDGWCYSQAFGDTPVALHAISVTLTPNTVFEGLDDV
jgi:Uma2 family endonuclease